MPTRDRPPTTHHGVIIAGATTAALRHRRTLLGVWAHPDDEAYLSAGLMAAFRRRGDRVVVVTATLGEHGTDDPGAWPPERLALVRRAELRTALAALDVHELHVLGFEDGDCWHRDGTAAIARHIADVQPDVIVTFGPDGMTGHPDHRAVSRWTTAAWAATRPDAALWYATLTPAFHARWGGLHERIGLWADQPDPPCTADEDLVSSTVLDDDVLARKLAALAAHASQTGPLAEMVGAETFREWWRTESFRAAPPQAADARRRAGGERRTA
jgi:LmbE family N-acetylglucosaminyl deacetylase